VYLCLTLCLSLDVCVSVCVYRIEYYSVHKKNEILLFSAISTDLENMLGELSQTEKYCIPLTCEI